MNAERVRVVTAKPRTDRTALRARERSTLQRTREAQERFLVAYAELGNVGAAAMQADVGRRTVYDWLQDAEYAERHRDARESACDRLEEEARRRAVDGVERPIWQRGQVVGSVREYSDRLLEMLLRANRPEKYRDRHSTELTVANEALLPVTLCTLDVTKLSEASLDAYYRITVQYELVVLDLMVETGELQAAEAEQQKAELVGQAENFRSGHGNAGHDEEVTA